MRRLMMTVFRKSAIAALFSLFFVAVAAAQTVSFDKAHLKLVTQSGHKLDFSVELAIDDAQRTLGLMHRKTMPADHGMLFDFGVSREVIMWMRNTVLPLDMLFIDESGTVQNIRENAVPFSEDLIPSNGDVRYVLELNAGTVRRLGIATGSHAEIQNLRKVN